jgi:hypothetical protein
MKHFAGRATSSMHEGYNAASQRRERPAGDRRCGWLLCSGSCRSRHPPDSRFVRSRGTPMDSGHRRCAPNRLARQFEPRTGAIAQLATSGVHVLQSGG